MEKNKWQSGILAFHGEECVHFALYEGEDAEPEIEALREELDTDEEFGLVGLGGVLYIRTMFPEELPEAISILDQLVMRGSGSLDRVSGANAE